MGPFFVIFLGLLGAAAVGSIWVVLFGLFYFGRLRNSRPLIWLGGIPLAFITIVIVGVVSLIGFNVLRAMNPRAVYRDTFHERPSDDVRQLKSKVWYFADEGKVFMRFEASSETFNRILPQKMEKISFGDYKEKLHIIDYESPSWWSPPNETTSEIYFRDSGSSQGQRFASENTVMTYDAGNRTVMYFYLGID